VDGVTKKTTDKTLISIYVIKSFYTVKLRWNEISIPGTNGLARVTLWFALFRVDSQEIDEEIIQKEFQADLSLRGNINIMLHLKRILKTVSIQYAHHPAKAVKMEYFVRRFTQFDSQDRAIINFMGYEDELKFYGEYKAHYNYSYDPRFKVSLLNAAGFAAIFLGSKFLPDQKTHESQGAASASGGLVSFSQRGGGADP